MKDLREAAMWREKVDTMKLKDIKVGEEYAIYGRSGVLLRGRILQTDAPEPKTTSWMRAPPKPIVWLQLDEEDGSIMGENRCAALNVYKLWADWLPERQASQQAQAEAAIAKALRSE